MADEGLNEKMRKLDLEDVSGPVGNEPAGPEDGKEAAAAGGVAGGVAGKSEAAHIPASPYKNAIPPPQGSTVPLATDQFSTAALLSGRRGSRIFGVEHTLGTSKLIVSEHELGQGACGFVHKATLKTKHGDKEVVAKDMCKLDIKFALPVLQNESEIYQHLSEHENITKMLGSCIFEGDETDDNVHKDGVLVLEYHPRNLQEAIEAGLIKSFRDVLKVLLGIARGLRHLHQHGVVHFDLKPSNILLTDDLVAKIVDFGVSKIRHDMVITLTIQGTYQYMAPELLAEARKEHVEGKQGGTQEKQKVSRLIDVFSFGKLAIDMVIGTKEYDKESREDVITKGMYVVVGGNERPIPCERPKELRDLITQCLQYDDDDPDRGLTGYGRPTADELVKMLENMLTSNWVDDPIE